MSGSRSALAPLTGLRGVAAYSVLIAHAFEMLFLYQDGPAVLHGLAFRLAYFGMSLFFVLSGFVLFYTYGDKFATSARGISKAAYGFFVSRFARLYPLYIIGLAAYSPHGLPKVFEGQPALQISYLTLTQTWFNWQSAFFPPDWSISTEWFFYLGFIPVSLLVCRINRPVLALAGFGAVAAIGIYAMFRVFGTDLEAAVQHWLVAEGSISSPARWWLTYLAPPLRFLEFVAGMLAANVYLDRHARANPPKILSAALTVSACYIVFLVSLGGLGQVDAIFKDIISNIAFAPAISVFLCAVCLSRGLFNRILGSRPFLFIGEISYSVYMWSFLVFRLFPTMPVPRDFAMLDALPAISDMAFDVVLTTCFAYGSYHLIESPTRKWIRRALLGVERRDPAA
jgi:peptidoglycan/LPS O-acetylase OafA/YrhL